MSVILEVEHTTIYRYNNPVRFGEHRMMFRPRTSHDIRVLECTLDVTPDAEVRWADDVFSNSLTYVNIREPAKELRFVVRFTIEQLGVRNVELPLSAWAEVYPFEYTAGERYDLRNFIEPVYPDPSGLLRLWADQFVVPGRHMPTRDLLMAIATGIREQFSYTTRDMEGTQTPLQTLELKSGTCRDYALFMMEVVRRLGFAARFVSGYLYDPALDGGADAMTGSGATHAWLQIYLPGPGWVPCDPTNTLFGGDHLIRVAYVRDPSQASPLSGSFIGQDGDFAGLEVDVKVRKLAMLPNELQERA
ncbi:transglutaminase family protein [Zoogloea sp.]|uniref:transglutaminase family protein n=1 Tax=Zoogloea sp. TaxID=49181 RepID=UPI001415D0C4|nr:MAG: transglutaminase family protein [Zoogloea sp.]